MPTTEPTAIPAMAPPPNAAPPASGSLVAVEVLEVLASDARVGILVASGFPSVPVAVGGTLPLSGILLDAYMAKGVEPMSLQRLLRGGRRCIVKGHSDCTAWTVLDSSVGQFLPHVSGWLQAQYRVGLSLSSSSH